MVGSLIAADMARDFGVTIADVRESNLTAAAERVHRIAGVRPKTAAVDLSDPAKVTDLVRPYDIVLGALASRIGLQSLKAVIEAGKNYADISFMAQDSRQYDALARSRGVTCVTDCGVAPGMSNILAARGAAMLDVCSNIEIYVGGLPRVRRWPFDYKAGFSPADVIEEYTRPSRVVENGQIVVKEALSEPELLDFPGVGTLEAFNTDGLRSLADALKVPNMKEKTLRYPGHIELMRVFRHTGLFSEEPVEVGGVKVKPLELTSKLLFPKWTYEPGEEDLTVMRVLADGMKDGRRTRLVWDLLDFYDPQIGCTSMARTTAFPCTIVARMIHAGTFRTPGVFAPETLGAEASIVDHLIRELGERRVKYVFHVEHP